MTAHETVQDENAACDTSSSNLNYTDLDNNDETLNKTSVGVSGGASRSEFHYSIEFSFESHAQALNYIESQRMWKFERTRPTKKGSKGFYHCRLGGACKCKIYLLTKPNTDEAILYRNNMRHNHANSQRNDSSENTSVIAERRLSSVSCDYQSSANYPDQEQYLEQEQDEKGANEESFFVDAGPSKYFVYNQNSNEFDDDVDSFAADTLNENEKEAALGPSLESENECQLNDEMKSENLNSDSCQSNTARFGLVYVA